MAHLFLTWTVFWQVYCTYETIEKTVVHNVSLSNGTVVLSNGMETELIPLEKCESVGGLMVVWFIAPIVRVSWTATILTNIIV